MTHHAMRDHRQAPVYPRGRPQTPALQPRRRKPILLREVTDADRKAYAEALSRECRRLSDEISANLFMLSDEELASIDEHDDRVCRVLNARAPNPS